MNYAELTDDELRLEVARRCGWTNVHMTKRIGLRGRCPQGWDDSVPNYTGRIYEAIALLESTGAEYNFGKRITGTPKPVYDVIIWGYYSALGDDHEAAADTLPRAACVAWLMWMEAKEGK